jgi:hypothetical protein
MSIERRILATFDLKRTTAPAPARPDELMIDWTNLPKGASASIYLPGADADDILANCQKLYGYLPFTKLDAATLGCPARGVSLMPVPRSSGNLAGLLEVQLPARARVGEKYTVAVSQATTAAGRIADPDNNAGLQVAYLPPRTRAVAWRKLVGTFKLAVVIRGEKELAPTLERNLSLLKWIFKSIPAESRWRPIFVRYLGALEQQLSALGVNPAKIPGSSDGVWPGGPGWGQGRGGGGHGGHGGRGEGPRPDHHRHGVIGKIVGLVFDHFGDFEGFILETEWAERIQFFSREKNMKQVAERAWADQLRVTVYGYDGDEHRPHRVVLHYTPDPL